MTIEEEIGTSALVPEYENIQNMPSRSFQANRNSVTPGQINLKAHGPYKSVSLAHRKTESFIPYIDNLTVEAI
jgi:hypothetical protein